MGSQSIFNIRESPKIKNGKDKPGKYTQSDIWYCKQLTSSVISVVYHHSKLLLSISCKNCNIDTMVGCCNFRLLSIGSKHLLVYFRTVSSFWSELHSRILFKFWPITYQYCFYDSPNWNNDLDNCNYQSIIIENSFTTSSLGNKFSFRNNFGYLSNYLHSDILQKESRKS